MAETFLTVQGTAEYLQVSRSIIYALVEAGKLVCHRIGTGRGTIRISQADILAYLDSCRCEKKLKDRGDAPEQKYGHLRL